ncbi:MAG TPA: polymorphic toxin type 44 domain-containing protein, partial [Clostridia bacterium]|nr:polymorphic toxin type 44 domain-containing protein [Clostridia bacterium]
LFLLYVNRELPKMEVYLDFRREHMRTILKRIGNDITQSKLKDDEMFQLHNERSTQSANQTQQSLQEKLRNFTPKKTEAKNEIPFNSVGQKPIGITSAGKGIVYEANQTGNGIGKAPQGKTSYIPISVVTGGRDITTFSPKLRTYLLQGEPSAASAIPTEYADVANVLEKVGDVINFDSWADLSTKQQLAIAQRTGLSEQDQQKLLNSSPRYVETIAKIQDVFANRYELGITLADARNVAKELIDIANEREEAYTRTGKYQMDAVFAPKAMQWLDEKEKETLDNLTKNIERGTRRKWNHGDYLDELYETSADIHRRAKYADINEAEASNQIEAQIMKNIEEAKKLAALSYVYGNAPGAFTEQAKWFLDNVTKNKPMDYKNPAVWYKTFPDLPYPKEDQVYDVFGYKVSSSDLGNLNYALLGKVLGIPEQLLLQQAGAAQLRDHKHYGMIKSQIESMKDKDIGYGDELDDQSMIEKGFEVYKKIR